MFDPEMGERYSRDHADQRRLKELREHIAQFVDNPPGRATGPTLDALAAAVDALGADIAHVDQVWD